MQKEIHPSYAPINATCSCGHKFSIGSTLGKDLRLDVCSKCHPYYTGKQKLVDTEGRVDGFNKKFAAFGNMARKKTPDAE
ncbi:MAG: 50S ribosomal protein L31 [Gammaproteobacteria bacterium]|nr:50S ribosomal protein L31 [Gammaproteobacteria bacterium]